VLFTQGWPQTMILLPLVSHIAGLIVMYHHAQLIFEIGSFFFNLGWPLTCLLLLSETTGVHPYTWSHILLWSSEISKLERDS
jgi:hypothetical protein